MWLQSWGLGKVKDKKGLVSDWLIAIATARENSATQSPKLQRMWLISWAMEVGHGRPGDRHRAKKAWIGIHRITCGNTGAKVMWIVWDWAEFFAVRRKLTRIYKLLPNSCAKNLDKCTKLTEWPLGGCYGYEYHYTDGYILGLPILDQTSIGGELRQSRQYE